MGEESNSAGAGRIAPRSERPRTYFLRSFGCQMNDHDSERIAGLLEQMGLSRRHTPEEARYLVYNTCSIREKADTRLAGHLGDATKLKREDPSRLVVVTGCLAQSRKNDLYKDFPCIDVLAGPQSLHELPLLIEQRLATGDLAGAFQEVTTAWSAIVITFPKSAPAPTVDRYEPPCDATRVPGPVIRAVLFEPNTFRP